MAQGSIFNVKSPPELKYIDVDCQLVSGQALFVKNPGVTNIINAEFLYNDDFYYICNEDNNAPTLAVSTNRTQFSIMVKNGSSRKLKVRVWYI